MAAVHGPLRREIRRGFAGLAVFLGRARHPPCRRDHLIALHVAVGAAEEDPGRLVYREANFFGRIVSSYRFG